MGIQALNISKRFGDFVALDDISIDVRSGRLTALLGPSGGGKSTLLRVIAGLDQADSGTVRIEGADAYAQEGQLTTFFRTTSARQVVDCWSVRLASFRTSEILAVRRVEQSAEAAGGVGGTAHLRAAI